jgi:hypothetical protein
LSWLWSGPATNPSSETHMWLVTNGMGAVPPWLEALERHVCTEDS